MTVNPLPPQAYTKETLQKAYTWLLTQNSSVKEMATSQEILVSLYLKAQRSGDAALETPSIQNFKQELKSLASMMGDFQPPQSQQPYAPSHLSLPTNSRQHPTNQVVNPIASQPINSQPNRSINSNSELRNGMPQSFAPSSPSGFSLDEQSMQAIQEVKQALNLSSDSEALRALISLGYRQFKKM